MTVTASTAEAKVLRAIVAREDRKEKAARRDAQNASRAILTPGSAGWSTKAAPQRKLKGAAKDLGDRIGEIRDSWARRHPDVARAERAIRKSNAETADHWTHKAHGTPQTHENARRTLQGSLARLHLSGAISADQLAWSVEIAEVVERIGSDCLVKTASLETRIDMTRMGDGTFYERLGHVRREIAYTRWRGQLKRPALILDMIAGDMGVSSAAQLHRVHKRKAKLLLIDALDLWPKILGDACKEVDPATLAAAHAGLLA